MTCEYKLAKELAENFLAKKYDVDSTVEYLIKNHYPYSFAVKVAGYVRESLK